MVWKDTYNEDPIPYCPNQDIFDNEERESINNYTRTRCPGWPWAPYLWWDGKEQKRSLRLAQSKHYTKSSTVPQTGSWDRKRTVAENW